MKDLAEAVEGDATLRRVSGIPEDRCRQKSTLLVKAFGKRLPPTFVRFLQSLVRNRRQTLVPAIAREYARMLDQAEGRVRAHVTVARPLSGAEEKCSPRR